MLIKEKIKNNELLYNMLLPIVTAGRHLTCRINFLFFLISKAAIQCNIVEGNELIKNMKDRYCDSRKRAFVVATGPSLTIEDLNKLDENKEITISVNGIFRIFEKTKWRPTYYLLGDEAVFRMDEYQRQKYENLAIQEVLLSTMCKDKLNYYVDEKKIGFFRLNRLDHSVNSKRTSKWFRYSNDYCSGVFDFYTITANAVMLADYMGIKEIYLIGVDANYTGTKAHAGQESRELSEKDISAARKQYQDQITGYEYLNKFANKRGINIYNATRGGSLEVFPRVSFADLF